MKYKLKCSVCKNRFVPLLENKYIVRDRTSTGIAAALSSIDEPQKFDAFDCPQCGCQIVAKVRMIEVK